MKTLVAVLAFVPLFATAAQPASVPWACGGVSAEERRALPAEVPGANLELLFVQGKRGAYTSGTQWRVFDRANEPIAYGTSDGPQCFLRLPEGAVRVEARLGGEVKAAKANIRAGDKRARLAFTFAAEPDEEIEASPEEKAQARQ
jgi:hypothetical protein